MEYSPDTPLHTPRENLSSSPSTNHTPTLGSINYNSNNKEISDQTNKSSSHGLYSDLQGLSKNLINYANNYSFSDVIFIVGTQQQKVNHPLIIIISLLIR